jgi:nitrogen PTS system EIIA component
MQLTVKDVAKLLNLSEKTIYRWITQGSLPAYRVNDQYRFTRAELLEWATSRRINVSPDIFSEIETSSIPVPTLAQALQLGGTFYRVEGKTREQVLRSIVEQMRLPEEVDRDFVYRVLLAREQLGSTAIGCGIAIPHVRNPIVTHVLRPTITLCFLETPVEFGALDGQLVSALFTIISPTVRAHLSLFSRLGFALRDSAFLQTIKAQSLREDILKHLERIEKTFVQPEHHSGTK